YRDPAPRACTQPQFRQRPAPAAADRPLRTGVPASGAAGRGHGHLPQPVCSGGIATAGDYPVHLPLTFDEVTMDAVARAAATYLALLIVFRIGWRLTLSHVTILHFMLLLVIGQVTGQSILADHLSVTYAVPVIMSLILFDLRFSLLKRRSSWAALHLERDPMIGGALG